MSPSDLCSEHFIECHSCHRAVCIDCSYDDDIVRCHKMVACEVCLDTVYEEHSMLCPSCTHRTCLTYVKEIKGVGEMCANCVHDKHPDEYTWRRY